LSALSHLLDKPRQKT